MARSLWRSIAQLSVAKILSLSFGLILFVSLGIFALISATYALAIIEGEHQNLWEQSEANIVRTFQLSKRLALENYSDLSTTEAEVLTRMFFDHKNGIVIDQRYLDAYDTLLPPEIRLYVINSDLVVIYSTADEDIGLNLGEFDGLDERLNLLLSNGGFFSGEPSYSIQLGMYRKYAYIASHDLSLIFEISHDIEETSGSTEDQELLSYVTQYSPHLLGARLYNIRGRLVSGSGFISAQLPPRTQAEVLALWDQVDSSLVRSQGQGATISQRQGQLIRRFVPITVNGSEVEGDNQLALLEMVYDEGGYWGDVWPLLLRLLIFALLILAVGIITTISVAERIQRPLNRMDKSLSSIVKNSQPALVEGAEGRELKRFQKSINDVLQRLFISLDRYNDSLVQLERSKSINLIVAGFVHDVQTPMGLGITAATHLRSSGEELSQLLDQGELTKGRLESYIDAISQSSSALERSLGAGARMVQSFKRLSSANAKDAVEAFDLHDFMEDLRLAMAVQKINKGVTIEFDCPQGIVMVTRRGPLNQVVLNIIVNGLKHGFVKLGQRQGLAIPRVVVRVVEYLKDQSPWVEISIMDNGSGIPQELQEAVFDPFMTRAQRRGGTGLGLHVVKTLVENELNGEVAVESPAIFSPRPHGTTMRVRIPTSVDQVDPS